MPSVHNIAECGWGENSTKNTKGGQRKYLFFAILLLKGAFFGFILLNSFDFFKSIVVRFPVTWYYLLLERL